MAAGPVVSVVVAAHNRRDRVAALLASLRNQTLDPGSFEVIVVDDSSADGTGSMAEAEAQRSPYALAVVERPEQGGPARARNDGWRLAAAPLVAFIDDDCEATPTWLERLSAAASAAPGAVVQGRTRPNPRELEAAGPFSVTRDVDGSGAWWFETCNIAYPREVLERLEGFDESFPEPLGEDTDLGWRALGAGGRRVFVDDAVVDHAVEDLGRAGHLRRALRGADAVLVFERHPRLREQALDCGIVRSHANLRLLLALAGLALARRRRPAALLALPYLKLAAGRVRRGGGDPTLAAHYLAHDMLSLATTARGDLRHRVLVI